MQPVEAAFPPGARHVLALDGGGVRGIVTLRMLEAFEERFEIPASDFFDLFAGTSTGAIIAALLAFRRLRAKEVLDLYRDLVGRVFEPTFSSSGFGRLLSRVMYPRDFAEGKLEELLGDATLGDLPAGPRGARGILLTTHDLVRDEELFLSNFPLKEKRPNYGPTWKARDAVAASALSAPWFFGPWEGRFVDGGLTVFNTPARQAAIEALDYCANPKFREGATVVWSFGSGAFASNLGRGQADGWFPWTWASRLFRDVQSDSEADQVFGASRMAERGEIGFRRYQVTITDATLAALGYRGEVPDLPIALDRADARDFLDEVGRLFARRIDWSDPAGDRLSSAVADPFADPQLWRSPKPPPTGETKPKSARLV